MMKNTIIIIFCLMIFSFPGFAGEIQVPFAFPDKWSGRCDRKKAAELFEQGVTLIINRKLAEGIKLIGKSYDANPFDIEPLLYLYQFCDDFDPIPEMKGFYPQFRKRILRICRKYPKTPDFEYLRIRTLNNREQQRKRIYQFNLKYPEHKKGNAFRAYTCSYIYYGNLKGLDIPLARSIILGILQKDLSWAGGWSALGNTYAYKIPKPYANDSMLNSCLRLGAALGASSLDMLSALAALSSTNWELRLNSERDMNARFRPGSYGTDDYASILRYAYFALLSFDKKEAKAVEEELKHFALSPISGDWWDKYMLYQVWGGKKGCENGLWVADFNRLKANHK